MNKRSKLQIATGDAAMQDEYASELKRVYKEIDKFSNLMTPLRDVDEVYWKTNKR